MNRRTLRQYTISILTLLLWGFSAFAATSSPTRDELIKTLDATLARRSEIVQRKQHRIDSLKAQVRTGISDERRTDLYNQIYTEYITFSFDSALTWAQRAENFARAVGNEHELARNGIHRAVALATSGYCSQAIEVLDTISINRHPELMADYYSAYEWIYGAWEEFGPIFAQEYHKRRAAYLDSLVNILPADTPQYDYILAERALSSHDYTHAIQYYNITLKHASPRSHLYAKASYALSTIYMTLGDSTRYEEHLIRAAITDQLVPAKENLALQELALYLKNKYGDVGHANTYLRYAIEDAIFFNSRLRMDGVAAKFPQIVVDYQDKVKAQKNRLTQYAIWLSALAVGITITLLIMIWQYRLLKRSRKEISVMNDELRELNRRLLSTNKFRDQYLTLFMELSASYVEKYNSFRSLVRLKLKAKQYDDLLRITSRSRTSDSEARETFFSFDYAFLRIYPDFVKEFNALLRPDMQIELRPNEILTTELRIFALIRMGVTDSAKIAIMLQYSPQTIYNYRTSVRNRAINRDTFEAEVMRLCTVIPEEESTKNDQNLVKKPESVENNSTNGEI